MGCVKDRWFANRTYKATKCLPVFYVQELAFRDLQSKQSVNIFCLGPTVFFLCRGIRNYHFKKNNLRAPFPPPKKSGMKNLLQRMMYFYRLFGVLNVFWYQDFSWDKSANEKWKKDERIPVVCNVWLSSRRLLNKHIFLNIE